MKQRIEKLTNLTLNGEMYPPSKEPMYNRNYIFLGEHIMQAKRIHDYILAQQPVLTEFQTMTGAFTFDGSSVVVGDAFKRKGHEKSQEVLNEFYLKPIDNLSTMEWQHATADFNLVINSGINGLIEKIEHSKSVHSDDSEKIEFLDSLKIVAETLIDWADKCSAAAHSLAQHSENPTYRKNLLKLSQTLKSVPRNPAANFYEAVLSIYIIFSCDPDSLGTLDRTLYKFYISDLEKGIITRDKAKEYLQELFLMIQSMTPKTSCHFTRGGESHFCVGGYNENGEDFFNDFSMLILEAVTELPTYIPQVSLRWTKKLSHDNFIKVLDMLRKDKNNRFAIVNDDSKINAFTDIAGFPFEIACKYSSVGCNEVAFPGGIVGGTSYGNILRSIETTLFSRKTDIFQAKSFDEFLKIYNEELFKDIDLIIHYDNEFNKIRAKDTNYITSLVFDDCIKNAESCTSGKNEIALVNPGLIGLVNVFDSLTVIKQFVYDEKIFSMEKLVTALENNWQGYEDMRALIIKKAKFFGNDDALSDSVAQNFCDTLYEYTKDKCSAYGHHIIFGNLEGYNPHHEWFGQNMKATPDGRYAGEMIKFGLSQAGGYDREGISALLKSISSCDKHGIITGTSSVTNISFDKKLITNDENFLKTASLLETYFINGGTQFQLTCVSAEELKDAKVIPEKYKNLRVRVSGFSDYFVKLTESLQNDIIERTIQHS